MQYSRIALVIAALFFGYALQAQVREVVFHPEQNIRLTEYGIERTLGWSGGMNNPQIATADLNNDGLEDLVIYEQYYKLKTFINKGTPGSPDYRYDPFHQHFFPYPLYDYLKLVDYNRDGVKDLFHRGAAGFTVYTGFYNSKGALDFKYYKDIYYQTPFSGSINAYCEPNDIPEIIDIDGDGDLDLFAYYIGGGNINFYRNCQVEENLPKDSIKVCVKDVCWGKTYQGYWREQMLAMPCSNVGSTCKGCPGTSGNKTTHTGNALCLLDYDGDGDFDYFTGSVSYPDVQFVKNGRVEYGNAVDTMTWQDTMWSASGHTVKFDLWPATFHQDIDVDGDKDLLFSPHLTGTENYKSLTLYENTGTDAAPSFVYRTDTFLNDKMVDFGSGSYPVFYDYDRDGKLDLLVGSDGYYQSNGTFKSSIAYYKNTSDGAGLSFTLQSRNFMQAAIHSFAGASLAIGDLNLDGKDDLVVGHTNGKLSFFGNIAASATAQPNWVLVPGYIKDTTLNDIAVGNYAAPFIYDLDKDGKKDLLVGCQMGTLYYYKNTAATVGQLRLGLMTQKLGDVKIDPHTAYGYSTPFIGKMDNTGVEYLMVGSGDGTIYKYDGFQSGNTTTAYTKLDSVYSEIRTDARSAPAFADIDGDNKYELVTGNVHGGIMLFRQRFNVHAEDVAGDESVVRIFPNPAKEELHVSWETGFAEAATVHISLTSVTGQVLAYQVVPAGNAVARLNIANIAPGIYYCIVQSGSRRSTSPVAIVR